MQTDSYYYNIFALSLNTTNENHIRKKQRRNIIINKNLNEERYKNKMYRKNFNIDTRLTNRKS